MHSLLRNGREALSLQAEFFVVWVAVGIAAVFGPIQILVLTLAVTGKMIFLLRLCSLQYCRGNGEDEKTADGRIHSCRSLSVMISE